MKTKFYLLLVLVAGSAQLFAQCGQRYKDMIFSNVEKDTIVYSTSNSTTLKMIVTQPVGDTANMRPVLIMAHGGSFIGGNMGEDNVCRQICDNYAKRGYVTADIQYRLAADAFDMLNATKAVETVLKAISDGKSAIRFFRKDAATTNTYKINPNWIFAGGNSAGAVLFMHVIYLDSLGEAPANFQTIINQNGGFEGNSGNDGYSSELSGIVNLAGGLNEAEFVGPGNKPSFNAQGDADVTVPYNCANAQSGVTPVQLCGLGVLQPRYDQFGIENSSIVYPGAGHCPWQNNAAMMTQVDTTSANFLYSLMCGTSTSVNDIKFNADITLFPNPANDRLNIRSNIKPVSVVMFDNLGREVINQPVVDGYNLTLNTSSLAKGVYIVKVEFADKNYATSVQRVVIE